ncbi:MAG: helix-turn-helix domain-containing protein [Verrucomicrobiota bacterium]
MASSTDAREPRAYSTIASEAKRVGVSERTLRNYLHEQGLPFIRLPGGDVRLVPEAVDEWMDKRRVAK